MEKSGWKTSEFWMAIGAIALVAIDSLAGKLSGGRALSLSDVLGIASVTLAYALGRSWLKGKASEGSDK